MEEELKETLQQELTQDVQPIGEAAEDFKEQQYKYIAFISYRHIEPDASVASKIHSMIETFKVPKEFYIDGKQPQFRVFRDREELTTSSLDDSLDEALRTSKFLIVICSKRLPHSIWCQKEVQTFKELHGIDRIIPVLIEGEPHESFPDALLNNDKEILAAELRPSEVLSSQFEGYAEIEKNDSNRLKRLTKESIDLLKTEKYRIMAAILGVTYGDLKQRDKERRNKLLLKLSALALVVLSVFGVFMFNAYRNENIAKRQTTQSRSAMLLEISDRLIASGDKVKALIVSQKAMDDVDSQMEMYPQLEAKHKGILNDAIYFSGASPIAVIKTDNTFTFLDMNKEGSQFVAGLKNRQVGLWDVSTGQLITTNEVHTEQAKVISYSLDNKKVYSGGFDDKVVVMNSDDLSEIKSLKLPGNIMLIDESFDGKHLIVMAQQVRNYVFRVYDTTNYSQVGEDIIIKPNLKKISISSTDNTMMLFYETSVVDEAAQLMDILSGKVIKKYGGVETTFKNYETNLEEKQIYPITEARFSKDGKSLYGMTTSYYFKMNAKTGKVDFIFNDKPVMTKEIFEGDKEIYVIDSIKLVVYDKNNGQWLREFSLPEGIKTISVKGNTIAVLLTDGSVSLIRDNQLINESIDFGFTKADDSYLYLTPDEKYILYLSLQTQEIKIAEVANEDKNQLIDGQILTTSSNSKYTLMYDSSDFIVYEVEGFKEITRINNSVFDFKVDYVLGDLFEISNDGKYLVTSFAIIDEKSQKRIQNLTVFDIKSQKKINSTELTNLLGDYIITPDSKSIVYLYNTGELIIQDLLDNKQFKKFILKEGFVDSLYIDDNSQYLVVNYTYGNSIIFDLNSGEELHNIGGKILHLENSNDGLIATGIYNNFGFTWKEVDDSYQQFKLSDKRSEYGLAFDNKNMYNHDSKLLLSIIQIDINKSVAYLIDFNNGELLKSFVINSPYFPNGIISPSGKNIIIDSHFRFVKKDNTDSYGNNEAILKTTNLKLLEYDELKETSKKIIKDRTLTKEELVELDLDY